jgi:hypothetical protein
LIAEAARYARFILKWDGFIAPLMMASTDDGILMFTPKDMNDEDGKDTFANTVSLIAGTYGASALVLIMEFWMTLASQESNLDMTPPSESYEREEVVTLIGQSKDGNRSQMYPIVRLDNGRFWNLGDPFELGADSFSGRFAGLLPTKEADLTMRVLGKKLLEAMGVELIPLLRR